MDCQNNPCIVPVGKVYATLSGTENACSRFGGEAVPVGKHYFYGTPTSPDDVIEILAPADNKHGVIIRTASCSPWNSIVILYTGTAAPDRIHNPDNPIIFGGNGSTPGTNTIFWLSYPLYLRPGQGLWTLNGRTEEGMEFTEIGLTYDILEAPASM